MAPKAKQKAKACEASKSRGGYNVDVPAECVEDVMTALVDEAREGGNKLEWEVYSISILQSCKILQAPISSKH